MNVPNDLNKDSFSLTENDKGYIINHDFKWINIDELNQFDFRPHILVDFIKNENKQFNHIVYDNVR